MGLFHWGSRTGPHGRANVVMSSHHLSFPLGGGISTTPTHGGRTGPSERNNIVRSPYNLTFPL